MKYTQNYNLKKPEGTDLVNIDDFNANADIIDTELAKRIVNAGNVPSIQAGLDGKKPAPSTVGRLYVATDTQILYRDTGTAWQKVGVVKWGDIEGKPSSFPPSAHKSTHASGGSDALTPSDIGAETPSGAQTKANAAEANAKGYTNTHAGTKNTHGVGSGHYIAKTSRSDQLPAWSDVQGKPSNFTPSAHKSTHAIGGSDALSPADIGAETPAGAQAKVGDHASAQASLTTLGHVKHAVLTVTLDTTWSETSPPYTKTVTVNGILASDTPIVDVVMSGTYATDEARIEQWGYVYRITTANNSITAYATDKPTVELPIQIKVVR